MLEVYANFSQVDCPYLISQKSCENVIFFILFYLCIFCVCVGGGGGGFTYFYLKIFAGIANNADPHDIVLE